MATVSHRLPPRGTRARRLLAVAVAIACVASLTTTAVLLLRPSGSDPPAPQAAGTEAAGTQTAGPIGAVVPTEIEIPAVGVRSTLVSLTVDAAGELQAPDDPAVAGWFAAGVVPGEIGPAVVGGHVDSKAGPGIFYALRKLKPADQIIVHRSDGKIVTFRVTALVDVPKIGFPTQRVYGPTPGPELRLVTCGGEFDRSAGSYLDNVIVEAVVA